MIRRYWCLSLKMNCTLFWVNEEHPMSLSSSQHTERGLWLFFTKQNLTNFLLCNTCFYYSVPMKSYYKEYGQAFMAYFLIELTTPSKGAPNFRAVCQAFDPELGRHLAGLINLLVMGCPLMSFSVTTKPRALIYLLLQEVEVIIDRLNQETDTAW